MGWGEPRGPLPPVAVATTSTPPLSMSSVLAARAEVLRAAREVVRTRGDAGAVRELEIAIEAWDRETAKPTPPSGFLGF